MGLTVDFPLMLVKTQTFTNRVIASCARKAVEVVLFPNCFENLACRGNKSKRRVIFAEAKVFVQKYL